MDSHGTLQAGNHKNYNGQPKFKLENLTSALIFRSSSITKLKKQKKKENQNEDS